MLSMKFKKAPKTPPVPVFRNAPDAEHKLTVKEVAELDRCSEKTVRRAIATRCWRQRTSGPVSAFGASRGEHMRNIDGHITPDNMSPTMSIYFKLIEAVGKSVTQKVGVFGCYAFPEVSALSTHGHPRPFRSQRTSSR
jgi:hypothetical protein